MLDKAPHRCSTQCVALSLTEALHGAHACPQWHARLSSTACCCRDVARARCAPRRLCGEVGLEMLSYLPLACDGIELGRHKIAYSMDAASIDRLQCGAVRKPCALPRVEVSGFGRRLERRKERRERGRMGVPRSLRSAVPVPRQQREEVKIHRIGSQGIGPLSCNHGASPACASRESNTPLSKTSRRVGAP